VYRGKAEPVLVSVFVIVRECGQTWARVRVSRT